MIIESTAERTFSVRLMLSIVSVFIGVFFLVLYFNRGGIHRFLLAEKLLPLPETFTELYFENHIKLPSLVDLGRKQMFSFTIHNLEARNMSYSYEVYIDTNGIQKPVDVKTIAIKDNGYTTIPESFTLTTAADRSVVVVNLKNKNQKIDFWIETNPPPTIFPTISKSPIITDFKKVPIKK